MTDINVETIEGGDARDYSDEFIATATFHDDVHKWAVEVTDFDHHDHANVSEGTTGFIKWAVGTDTNFDRPEDEHLLHIGYTKGTMRVSMNGDGSWTEDENSVQEYGHNVITVPIASAFYLYETLGETLDAYRRRKYLLQIQDVLKGKDKHVNGE